MVAIVRWVWKSPSCAERTALLLLAAAALLQSPWHFPRLVIVTMALLAAVLVRRVDANR